MSEVEQNDIVEALRKARAEGEFQGRVLTKLDQLGDAIKVIEMRDGAQSAVIANKAEKSEVVSVQKKVDSQARIIWMATGALAVLQFLIGAALANH